MERFLAALGIIVGSVFGVSGLVAVLDGEASRKWPTTEGRVLASSTEAVLVRNSDPAAASSTEVRYRERILYSYEVRGRRFTNDRVEFEPPSRSQYVAKSMTRRFPSNSVIHVHYRPAKPSDSVVLPGSSLRSLTICLGGFMSAGWSAWKLWTTFGRRPRAHPDPSD